ncbi:MAG TPA: hypothetical protein PKD12_08065, partial [Nitrospira sp.]|nr:hypothetical protein [Nitrospira sp.]
MQLPLYPHQEKALKKMHNGCILVGGVGSGKTKVALEYYKANEAPKPIIVITTAKKRDSMDWEDEARFYDVYRAREEVVGDGQLTVDSWNNIEKYAGLKDCFFVFDEQRLVGAGKWSKTFIKIAKSNHWILLSATPGDTWLDYIPVFVANGFYKNRTEFKREHVVYNTFTKYPKVDRYIGVNKLVKLRHSILVEMPYLRHTTRHVERVYADYDRNLLLRATQDRWNPYEERPIKDVAELFLVMRKIVNSNYSRVGHIHRLQKKHKRLIVFYNFNFELEMLRLLGKYVPIAEWNGHKHEEIPETDEWIYLVQYVAGAEGWNCTS